MIAIHIIADSQGLVIGPSGGCEGGCDGGCDGGCEGRCEGRCEELGCDGPSSGEFCGSCDFDNCGPVASSREDTGGTGFVFDSIADSVPALAVAPTAAPTAASGFNSGDLAALESDSVPNWKTDDELIFDRLER